jgi:hypothetical protein
MTPRSINRLIACAISKGVIASDHFWKITEAVQQSPKKYGITAKKRSAKVSLLRGKLAVETDRVIAALERHLDVTTADVLDAHFRIKDMPTPSFDVNWVAAITNDAYAQSVFGSDVADTADIAEAKLIIKPMFVDINNVLSKAGRSPMAPFKRAG